MQCLSEGRWQHGPVETNGTRCACCSGAHLEGPQLAITGIAGVVAHADGLSRLLAPAVQQDHCQALAITRQDRLRPQSLYVRNGKVWSPGFDDIYANL